MKKCPKCGHTQFVAHQVVHMDIIVDGNNEYVSPCSNVEQDIYQADTPFGPYQCMCCHEEFDELNDLPETNTIIVSSNGEDITVLVKEMAEYLKISLDEDIDNNDYADTPYRRNLKDRIDKMLSALN